jgi:hypothetical protein
MVTRSRSKVRTDTDFWNPKLRAAICFNAPAARTYLPITIKKTELVLAGRSKPQMFEGIKIAFDKKELPLLESSVMRYMMSKQSYLSDHDGHWHPHLMFCVPLTDSAAWGANLPGSPILGSKATEDGLTVFLVPVAK